MHAESKDQTTVGESMACLVQTTCRQSGMADRDWGPFSFSGMNREEVCLRANTEDVMPLPHCRTISESRYWLPVCKLPSNLLEASRREHSMFCQQDTEKHFCRQGRQMQQYRPEVVRACLHKVFICMGCLVSLHPLQEHSLVQWNKSIGRLPSSVTDTAFSISEQRMSNKLSMLLPKCHRCQSV